jgi:hypothetical protein
LNRRKKMYLGMEGGIPDIEVLEQLHDSTDAEAGDREIWWCDKLGYKQDTANYLVSRKWVLAGSRKGNSVLTSDQRSKNSRLGALARVRNLTPQQLSEIGRKAGLVGGRRSGELGRAGCQIRDSCPNCGRDINRPNLKRHLSVRRVDSTCP